MCLKAADLLNVQFFFLIALMVKSLGSLNNLYLPEGVSLYLM
jgi:hypothetical protein